jgi:hypothetical protein
MQVSPLIKKVAVKWLLEARANLYFEAKVDIGIGEDPDITDRSSIEYSPRSVSLVVSEDELELEPDINPLEEEEHFISYLHK